MHFSLLNVLKKFLPSRLPRISSIPNHSPKNYSLKIPLYCKGKKTPQDCIKIVMAKYC